MKGIKWIFIMAVAAVVANCSCGKDTPYKRIATAYNSINLTARLAEAFDAALNTYFQAKRAECKKQHQIKTAEYDKCILPSLRISRAWTGEKAGVKTGKGILPWLQTLQKAARLSTDASYDYLKSHEAECKDKPATDTKCYGDWKKVLPAVCGMVDLIDKAVAAGAYDATTNATYKAVKAMLVGYTCPKGA